MHFAAWQCVRQQLERYLSWKDVFWRYWCHFSHGAYHNIRRNRASGPLPAPCTVRFVARHSFSLFLPLPLFSPHNHRYLRATATNSKCQKCHAFFAGRYLGSRPVVIMIVKAFIFVTYNPMHRLRSSRYPDLHRLRSSRYPDRNHSFIHPSPCANHHLLILTNCPSDIWARIPSPSS